MPSQCSKCTKNVTDKRYPGLSCAFCNQIFHISCTNISKDSLSIIIKNQLAWSCTACKTKSSTRRSGIFPSVGSSVKQTPVTHTATSDNNALQDLISAFNNYKETTDARIVLLESLIASKDQQFASLTESIQKVGEKAEEIVQLSIASTLEVQGVPEESLESPIESVLSIAASIGCVLSAQEIECTTSRPGSKPVIAIKFNSSVSRQNFLHAGKKFNREKNRIQIGEEDHKIFVNEQLTSAQKNLLYNTKAFARTRQFNFAWFCNGLVHLKKQSNSELIIIRSQNDLDILTENTAVNTENEAQLLPPERERSPIQNERTSPRRQIQ